MSKDISEILSSWEFSPDQNLVRRVRSDDGREVIQRRIELGILQIEVEDRPDGARPYGFPSLYDYYKHFAEEVKTDPLPGDPFQVSPEVCEELQIEALLYYQRRLCFFELQDYSRAARDARRNLEVFDFVRNHAQREEDVLAMDQYRAFVIFHRGKAEVLGCLERKEYDFALEYIEAAEREIKEFFEAYDRPEIGESSEELKQLQRWREEIERLRPLSKKEILEQELSEAIEREEYERAAKLRDEIQNHSEQNEEV